MSKKLKVTAEPGHTSFATEYTINAPRELVYKAFTEAEHLKNWMGPGYLTTIACEVDHKIGGGWRMQQKDPEGNIYEYGGKYLALDPGSRMIGTFEFAGMGSAMEMLQLEDVDGGTLITTVTIHESVEARDGHLQHGMEDGMIQGYVKLEQVCKKLQ